MSDTHVHIPSGFEGVITIKPDGTVNITSKNAQDHGFDFEGGSVLADLLLRHEKYDPATRSREVAQALIDLGWQPFPHPKYGRFVYTGEHATFTCFLSSKDLLFRKDHLDFLLSLGNGAVPGNPGTNEVRMPVTGPAASGTIDNVAKIALFAVSGLR